MFRELLWSHRHLGKAIDTLASLPSWQVMAKNIAWKLLGHRVGILIFCPNKILLSKFWLEIWWEVVKHRNTPFPQVWWDWCVPTGRYSKWLEPQNSREIRGLCHLDSPKKGSVNFFDHHCKSKVLRSSQTFFMQKVCFQRVWLRVYSLVNGRK